MTGVNDIWAAAFGTAFANIVETVFNSQDLSGSPGKTRGQIAEKIRIETAKEAREVATEAVRGMLEVQEAEMTDEDRAEWEAENAETEAAKG